MFGYIVVNKPELKIREFDVYKEYYCGLCHGLKRNYGVKGQFCLTYDYVFLVMILTGLYEPEEIRNKKKCILHPVRNQIIRDNKFIDYVSDMGIVLTRLKCADDWTDERKIVRKAYGDMLKNAYERIKEKYPEKIEIVEQSLMNIAKAEKENEYNIDVVSGYFGRAFEEICAVYEDEWEVSLRKIGFYLGKFIYILDAYDDVLKDVKENHYNPFKEKYKEPGFDEYVHEILTLNAAECAREFEKLPIINEVEILRNILYSGIWSRFTTVSDRRKTNEKSL